MTATERVRELLDERGVEHVDEKDGKFLLVTWCHNETSATFVEDTVSGETSIAISAIVSPEQAIAATLGSCNCSNNCTDSERTGTCHNSAPSYLDFLCSECGFVHYHSDTNDTGDGNEWCFCPNCGRRIEVDE